MENKPQSEPKTFALFTWTHGLGYFYSPVSNVMQTRYPIPKMCFPIDTLLGWDEGEGFESQHHGVRIVRRLLNDLLVEWPSDIVPHGYDRSLPNAAWLNLHDLQYASPGCFTHGSLRIERVTLAAPTKKLAIKAHIIEETE